MVAHCAHRKLAEPGLSLLVVWSCVPIKHAHTTISLHKLSTASHHTHAQYVCFFIDYIIELVYTHTNNFFFVHLRMIANTVYMLHSVESRITIVHVCMVS